MTAIAEPDMPVSLEAKVRDAHRYLSAGDIEGALAILEPLTSDGAYLPARFLLSMTAWKMGRLDWAIELMRQCHETWPMDGTVAEVLASLYAQVGDLRESLFMGKMGTALGGPGELSYLVPEGFPNFDWAFYHIKNQPLLVSAKASLASGNLADAVAKARQHSGLNPQDGDGHAFLAALLLKVGAAAEAVEVLSQILHNADFPAAYASLYARSLAAVGDFAEAQKWHEKAVSLAPKDSDIAAARIADGFWLEQDPKKRALAAQDWARRFCVAPKPRQWHRPGGQLVIGYLVNGFADPLDIAYVAAVARAHDRAHVTVVGYGHGLQTSPANAPLSGAFDIWQDIRTLHPATLARFFERDGLHAIVDACGFEVPSNLMALARLATAVRVAWLGNPAGIGQPLYDARIVAAPGAGSDEAAWSIGCGYPVLRASGKMPQRQAHSGIHFGADVRMVQLDPTTVALWSSVMRAQPDSKLLLRANDMGPGANIDRLVERFGRDLAARIDIVGDEFVDEFYAAVDVALAPRRGTSPRVAIQALACGVPVIAALESEDTERCSALLHDLGLAESLVAANEQEFVKRAVRAASDGSIREQVSTAMAACGDGARRFAQAIEEHAWLTLESAEERQS